MSDIFRGENTISRRTLTPNLIGCFPPGSTNQRRALAAIPAASACVRSSSLDSIEDKRIVLSIQELRMKERESLDVCSMCLDTTRAGWKRVKRVNSSPFFLLYYCLSFPPSFLPRRRLDIKVSWGAGGNRSLSLQKSMISFSDHSRNEKAAACCWQGAMKKLLLIKY